MSLLSRLRVPTTTATPQSSTHMSATYGRENCMSGHVWSCSCVGSMHCPERRRRQQPRIKLATKFATAATLYLSTRQVCYIQRETVGLVIFMHLQRALP
jgi:hypothetical protein